MAEALTGGAAGVLEVGGDVAAQAATQGFQREQQLAELEAAPSIEEMIASLKRQPGAYGGRQ